jgi:uncharacterized membrane protein YkvA (DUF1232 family)
MSIPFLKRLTFFWTLIRGDARVLWHALRHPAAPGWLRWACLGLALYVVSPIDLIPDFLLGLGWLDDIVLVPMAVRWMIKRLPAHVRADAERATGR